MKKYIAMVTLIVLLLTMLSACNRSRHELVGTWKQYEAFAEDESISAWEIYYTFNEDGTGRIWLPEAAEGWHNTFGWQSKDGELTIEIGALPEWMHEERTPIPMPDWNQMVQESREYVDVDELTPQYMIEIIVHLLAEMTVTAPYTVDGDRLTLAQPESAAPVTHSVFIRVD